MSIEGEELSVQTKETNRLHTLNHGITDQRRNEKVKNKKNNSSDLVYSMLSFYHEIHTWGCAVIVIRLFAKLSLLRKVSSLKNQEPYERKKRVV